MTDGVLSRHDVTHYLDEWMTHQDLNIGGASGGDSLSDLGFDSLSIVDLATAVRRDLGVPLHASEIGDEFSYDATVDLILDRARSSRP
jgi:acyl carrier protein